MSERRKEERRDKHWKISTSKYNKSLDKSMQILHKSKEGMKNKERKREDDGEYESLDLQGHLAGRL